MSAKSIYIFDACAMIALIERESGYEKIEACLYEKNTENYIHAINLCEVIYDGLRRRPTISSTSMISDIQNAGIYIYWRMNANLLAGAADYKAQWRRISLADCFALALAHHLQGTLLTSDHHEFDPLVSAGERSISFFR